MTDKTYTVVYRVGGTEGKAFDVQLRECPRDIGK